MAPWTGKRKIAVVSACMAADGTPDFALNEVEVTHDEYENGIHYYIVEADLMEAGYDEPYTHFDQYEAPAFLHPAVREYLGMQSDQPKSVTPSSRRKPDAAHH